MRSCFFLEVSHEVRFIFRPLTPKLPFHHRPQTCCCFCCCLRLCKVLIAHLLLGFSNNLLAVLLHGLRSSGLNLFGGDGGSSFGNLRLFQFKLTRHARRAEGGRPGRGFKYRPGGPLCLYRPRNLGSHQCLLSCIILLQHSCLWHIGANFKLANIGLSLGLFCQPLLLRNFEGSQLLFSNLRRQPLLTKSGHAQIDATAQ